MAVNISFFKTRAGSPGKPVGSPSTPNSADITPSGVVQTSDAIPQGHFLVRIDTDDLIRIGVTNMTPVPTGSVGIRQRAGTTEYYAVSPGEQVQVIQAS